MMKGIIGAAGLLSLFCQSSLAIQLNINDERMFPRSKTTPPSPKMPKRLWKRLTLCFIESIKNAASTIAFGLMKYYTGNNTGDTPGNLP